MLKLLFYGYAVGIASSRRIEQATYNDVAFRYLAANQHPDHDTSLPGTLGLGLLCVLISTAGCLFVAALGLFVVTIIGG